VGHALALVFHDRLQQVCRPQHVDPVNPNRLLLTKLVVNTGFVFILVAVLALIIVMGTVYPLSKEFGCGEGQNVLSLSSTLSQYWALSFSLGTPKWFGVHHVN
jgi:hypothetical protein